MLQCDTLLFDVDGTLVDATKDVSSAMNHALGSVGLSAQSEDEIMSNVGSGIEVVIRKCLKEHAEKDFKKAFTAFLDYYRLHPVGTAKLYPNVLKVLEHYKHKRLFILTNRRVNFANATLKALGIFPYFEKIFGAHGEECVKPTLCPIERDPIFSSIDLSKALMIGDMDVDIQTGKNAGMKSCWVTYGLGKREDVEPLGPDFVINDILALTTLVR